MTLVGGARRHTLPERLSRMVLLLALIAASGLVPLAVATPAAAAGNPCGPPVTSVIACENTLPGDPTSDWQVSGAGDSTIQGYATSISVNLGQTVTFKINTPASSYHLDILRMGYYQGNGARKIVSGLRPTATLPQSQPACATDSTSGLVDCGTWAVSASWTVPTTAVSGVYLAHLVRDDTGGGSLIPFVVRNDASTSALAFQTSDETWQAYNTYGGNSLYQCTVACPPGNPGGYKAAYKVSYNRPFNDTDSQNGLLYAEYPMIRFLEANGYDVSYMSGLDVATRGSLVLNHKTFLSVGHDEYWSGDQRANVESARDHGVNLAFFSGNEVFWKTRWESSIAGGATPGRTLVSYKETHFDAPADPQDPPTWTGTWRDPRFSPPADGGRPENALTGQFFIVNSGTSDITVPAQYSKMRLWRNTAVANLTAGQSVTLGSGIGTLGYEWDEDADNGSRPAGLFDLSSTTVTGAQVFADYGTNVTTGTASHHLTLYRAASGALVFGAGTVQWTWGLDGATTGKAPDPTMQQATVNLFADMGAQPYTPISGIQLATASTDTVAPTSRITSPAPGGSVPDGTAVTISGAASDSGGTVAGVEVSTNGGATWHPATGTTSWTYSWIAHGSPSSTIKTRAVDDSGNLETPSTGTTVTVTCPCSVWGTNATPGGIDSGDGSSVEVGVKFTTDTFGTISGLRFYKASTN
ncbi:MAG TPA: N,N-dimethylformamidase beta subunit family domain-containing protein, partial [Nakamurella sp.]|nr:N,N-dimethylformamidase beta subunit family domain-containing protein [Nakamurella sp.]